jgi:hypothetical protein
MISIVTLVAYDYRYSYSAIESAYSIADEVIVGIDKERLSWSKKPYQFDESEFRAGIAKFDRRKIVKIVQDDFHREEHPMANDTRERNILSTHCKPGNWIVQIDSDERMLNARDFGAWLGKADPNADVLGDWITVFKTIGDHWLVVHEPGNKVDVATKVRGAYQYARKTGRPATQSNLKLLHFSWGRTRDELEQKLVNWSHARDFDVMKFLHLWDAVTLENYKELKNFHPLHAPLWSHLSLIKSK